MKEALVNHADAFAERPNIQLFDEINEGFGKIFSFYISGSIPCQYLSRAVKIKKVSMKTA